MSDLDKTFAEAAEIAKKLPENLQEAAFNRALDELLNGSARKSSAKSRGSSRHVAKPKPNSNEVEIEPNHLLADIDSTRYQDIGDTGRVADQALKVLQLARQDHGVDGLTASQIFEILTQKFRLPVKKNAVLMALRREPKTVDVKPGPNGQIFRIMAPGDDYLENLRASGAEKQTHHKGGTVKKKAKKPAGEKKAASKKKASEKTAKPKSVTLGPKAAIGKLITVGFFDSPRQISEVQEELKHNRGHTFSVQDLSPALLRYVRDEALSRSRNDSGQYEYSKA